MRTDLGRLSEDWKNINSIVVYGAGTVSRICENLFQKVQINISHVIDQDTSKQGKEWNGVKISSFESVQDDIQGNKIVVMAAHSAFNDIASFLEEQGLEEFRDFCRIGQFMCEWFWNVKHLNCVFHVDMTVTTRCTLNCKHCNMFIPYYEKQFNYSFEELRSNIDLLFERVDYVGYFGLIGGEPMLNPCLPDVITYLEDNYADKFGKISYASNGTVKPSEKLLEVMNKYGIHIVVSDYSKAVNYEGKINDLIVLFKNNSIQYDIKPSIEWCDFGFPQNPYSRNKKELENHLLACRPEWNGLNDGKFYYCNVSWSAEKSGHFKLIKDDYIVLESINPNDKEGCHIITELSRGTSSFCKICGGCGKDNTNYVKTGEQL